ncbi:hypothetical protein N4T77_01185 [Clostridium sp. CX1]|uniref:Uncharacterized protein n=1 Tax=Clostridium tanneri TaxID=3037988 RepID=A0ABU4JVH7_9CLOT|nr:MULTISPECIES: hypothetical protein [unclassified Clostridium]MCT8975204.1 hypothetical protein [Clostridium sp. CX1]MDW8802159.1 hypothetical protein [Clostridium sp. A1-XYC3]
MKKSICHSFRNQGLFILEINKEEILKSLEYIYLSICTDSCKKDDLEEIKATVEELTYIVNKKLEESK